MAGRLPNARICWRTWVNQLVRKFPGSRTLRRRSQPLARIENLEQRCLLTVNISGTVFNDMNGDKLKQESEIPLSGMIVYVDSDDDGQIDPDNIPDGGATE